MRRKEGKNRERDGDWSRYEKVKNKDKGRWKKMRKCY